MAFELRGVCPMIWVFDMPTSLAFYRDLLGFAIVQNAPLGADAVSDNFGWVWLRRDSAELMLNTVYDPADAARPSRLESARIAAHADITLYFDCPELDALYRELSAAGVHVKPPAVSYYGMTQLSIEDPDGFGLCFQRRAAQGDAARV